MGLEAIELESIESIKRRAQLLKEKPIDELVKLALKEDVELEKENVEIERLEKKIKGFRQILKEYKEASEKDEKWQEKLEETVNKLDGFIDKLDKYLRDVKIKKGELLVILYALSFKVKERKKNVRRFKPL